MEKPKIVIIDRSKKAGKETEEEVEKISKRMGVEFDTKRYSDLCDLKKAHLYLVRSIPGIGKEGLIDKAENVAKKISEQNPRSRKILILGQEEHEKTGSGESYESPESLKAREERAGKSWDSVVLKTRGGIDTKKLEQDMSILREEYSFSTPLNISLAGYGRFGKASLRKALSSPLVKKIDLYSEYYSTRNPTGYKAIKHTHLTNRINLHYGLESLVNTGSDILFIVTGQPFESSGTRDVLFEGTARKVAPIFDAVVRENYKGLIIVGSNPIELLLRLGMEMGIDPKQLVGESVTDTIRTRKLLSERYITDEEVEEQEIPIHVLGTHQQPVPILSKIKGRQDLIYHPYLSFDEFRKGFTRILRRSGKRAMRGSEKSGDIYSDAPRGFIEMIEDIANLRRTPRSCWSVYDINNGHYFTNSPVQLEYPIIRVSPIELPEIDKWERGELKRQRNKNFRTQRRLVERFLKEYGRK